MKDVEDESKFGKSGVEKIRRKRLDLESWAAYEDRPAGASFVGAVPRPAPLAHLLPLFTLPKRRCEGTLASRVLVPNSNLVLEIPRHSPSLFENRNGRLSYGTSLLSSLVRPIPRDLQGPLYLTVD